MSKSGSSQFRLPKQRWQIFPPQVDQVHHLADHLALSPLLLQVLINRGLVTAEQVTAFLEPESWQLPSPLEDFPDLVLSVELLMAAIADQQRIAICGDYDADGMTSTALLIRALRFLGADASYAIPSRMQEGYGINTRIVEEFHADGLSVILTVDNGIAAIEPILRARELGMTVIVTDHHDVPPTLPPANAILNPKLIREDSPYRGVAGVGVAYILAVCLAQAMGRLQDLTAPLLELFTLGTIADLAPLTGVNRRWVRRGLKRLPKSRVIGIQALIQVAGLSDQAEGLKPEDIGFKLGPRINAVGRIGDPQIVIEMLTTEDIGLALERAMQCEQLNQMRQGLCTQIEQEAIAYCEQQQQAGTLDLERDRILLVIQPGWHHGVIGIVASRLVERYGVPVFIGTYEDEGQKEIRGSARGIPEFNVFDALQACADLMDKFGGHRAAGGFSFPAKHLRQVKTRLVNFANTCLQLEHLKPLVTVDVKANLANITFDLYQQIDQLHPCGIENPDPVFWTANVRVVEQQAIGRNRDHLKVLVSEDGQPGEPLKAIAWRWGEYCPLPSRIDIAYKLKLNEWQGQQSVELELVGVRPHRTTPQPITHPPQPEPRLKAQPTSPPETQSQAQLSLESPITPAFSLETAPEAHPTTMVPAPPSRPTSPLPQLKLTHQRSSPILPFEAQPTNSEAFPAPASPAFEIPDPQVGLESFGVAESSTSAFPSPAESQNNSPVTSLPQPEITQPDTSKPEIPKSAPPKSKASKPKTSKSTPPKSDGSNLPCPALEPDSQPTSSPQPELALARPELDVDRDLTHRVDFFFSKRPYTVQVSTEQDDQEVQIRNAEGHVLVIQLPQRQGFLRVPGQSEQPIDISEPRYFNLVRSGLNALEIAQKTQLLAEKDELIAEKDAQIATLTRQVTLLEQKLSQLSTDQQQQFQTLQVELQHQESAIQHQEAHIAKLQSQMGQGAPQINPKALKEQVRTAIGNTVWYCLQDKSRKNLYMAYKYAALVMADASSNPTQADYSDAGLRLGLVVEREVVQPFFADLYDYLVTRGDPVIGGFTLSSYHKYTLDLLPPLLADQWVTLQDSSLQQAVPVSDGALYGTGARQVPLNERDRTLLDQFLKQWEHPLAQWINRDHQAAASYLDQISQLYQLANHANHQLYEWQFTLLKQKVMGNDQEQGLFRQIYDLPEPIQP